MAASWLIDTCVVSELAKATPEPAVVRWLEQHAQGVMVAAVSLGEIVYGVESLPVGARRNALQRWCGDMQAHFSGRFLLTDEAVWQTFGRLKASLEAIGRPQDDMDVLIAATATAHSLSVVARNVKHFKNTGVELLNPWEAKH